MIQFGYSDEDTKDGEGRESWSATTPCTVPRAKTHNHANPLSWNAPQHNIHMRDAYYQVGQAARRRPHWSPTIVEGNSARGRDESEQRACWEVGSRAGTM